MRSHQSILLRDGWQPGSTPCAKAPVSLGLAPQSWWLMGVPWRARQQICCSSSMSRTRPSFTAVAGAALEGKASHEVLGAAWDGGKAPECPFSSSALALGVINPPKYTQSRLCPHPHLWHGHGYARSLHPPVPWDLLGTAQADEWSKHPCYYQHAESQPSAPKGNPVPAAQTRTRPSGSSSANGSHPGSIS